VGLVQLAGFHGLRVASERIHGGLVVLLAQLDEVAGGVILVHDRAGRGVRQAERRGVAQSAFPFFEAERSAIGGLGANCRAFPQRPAVQLA